MNICELYHSFYDIVEEYNYWNFPCKGLFFKCLPIQNVTRNNKSGWTKLNARCLCSPINTFLCTVNVTSARLAQFLIIYPRPHSIHDSYLLHHLPIFHCFQVVSSIMQSNGQNSTLSWRQKCTMHITIPLAPSNLFLNHCVKIISMTRK